MSPRPLPETGSVVQSEFLLRLCHDMRSCLRSIRPQAEFLAKNRATAAPEELDRIVEFLMDGTRRLDSMLDGLAALAVAMQMEPSSFIPSSSDAILRRTLMKLERDYSGITGRVTYSDLPRVVADPDRLAQLFELLIRNSIQHGEKPDIRVHVAAAEHPEGWLFSVSDNGCGLEADSLETIFRPFERLHRKHSGPGLGLTTASMIVERHGGRIQASSQPGSGCTIEFVLPRIEE